MSSPKKKFEKKKAREKLKRQEKIQRDRDSLFPEVLIDSENGSPEFTTLISELVKILKLSDSKFFSEREQDLYKGIRKYGYTSVLAKINISEFSKEIKSNLISTLALGYGTRLFEVIPEEIKKKFLPFNDASINFRGSSMVITLKSMLQQKSESGTIFYSRKRPQVKFGENTFTAAFSRHAIERICERQNPNYLTYSGLGNAFAFFGGCVYFKPVYLYGDQPAFVLFNCCNSPSFREFHSYTMQVMGLDNLKPNDGDAYYLVGYCPVVFEKGFAKAKTFLIPGYSGTPEYGQLIKADLPFAERQRLLALAKDGTEEKVYKGENLELIKWFHDNGVPQVVQMKQKVFDYS